MLCPLQTDRFSPYRVHVVDLDIQVNHSNSSSDFRCNLRYIEATAILYIRKTGESGIKHPNTLPFALLKLSPKQA